MKQRPDGYLQGFTPSTRRFVFLPVVVSPGWNVLVYRSAFLGFPQRDYHPTCNVVVLVLEVLVLDYE